VNFVIPQETGMHYLDRVETDWPFRIQMPRGFNVPFHCTASGKTFMASLSKSAREKFIAGLSLKEHTQNTHTTADSLLKNLKHGYASLLSLKAIQKEVLENPTILNKNARFL